MKINYTAANLLCLEFNVDFLGYLLSVIFALIDNSHKNDKDRAINIREVIV
jgi:hypothetical protein